MDEKRTDTAAEPVETQEDNEFMDTGVLHKRPVKSGDPEDEDEPEDETEGAQ